jgi:hypothetical protein
MPAPAAADSAPSASAPSTSFVADVGGTQEAAGAAARALGAAEPASAGSAAEVVKAENVRGIGDWSRRVHGHEAREGHARHAERRELLAGDNRSFRTRGIRHRSLLFTRFLKLGELRDWQPLARQVAGDLNFSRGWRIGFGQIPASDSIGLRASAGKGEKGDEGKGDAL